MSDIDTKDAVTTVLELAGVQIPADIGEYEIEIVDDGVELHPDSEV